MSEKGGASNKFRDREGGLRSKKDDQSMLSPEESRCDVEDEGESLTRMARPAPQLCDYAGRVDVEPRGAGAGATRSEPAAHRGERWLHGGCGPIADAAEPELPHAR